MPLMPAPLKPTPSPVASQSFPPAPDGMNIAMPANQIADTEAVYLQDIILDQPGYARRRGPVIPVPGIAALPRTGVGAALTLNPQGSPRYAVLTTTGALSYFTVYSANMAAVSDVAQWQSTLATSPFPIVSAPPALNSGTMVGTSPQYGPNTTQVLAYWGGATNPDYTTGTLTATQGSTAVTGTGTAFLANVSPGMFLHQSITTPVAYLRYVGQVASVQDDTHLTLVAPSSSTFSGSGYRAAALRGIIPKVGNGTITVASGSTSVAGGNTKFLKQGLATSTPAPWSIYRASDLAFVGTVSSVQSDIALTLAAGAAVAMADDGYIAVPSINATSTVLDSTKPGFLTAVYAERQWYANNGSAASTTYRLWFSDTTDPEVLDMTADGNWIPINSTGTIEEPIVGLGSAYNALVVLKETETFGVFGSDPTSFQVTKLVDDGALSGMSVQQYGGGVLWAGRQGIHMFDGTQVNDLTSPKFGQLWREMMETFDPSTYRMWSMIERDHYILHVEHLTPSISVTKGATTTTPNHWVVVVNLKSGAIALWQNVKFRGAIRLPLSANEESWYLYNDGTKAVLGQASNLFDSSGNDSAVEGMSGGGPDFYFESKKFDGGNPTRLKRFTYFLMHYLAVGDSLQIDTVLGLNTAGTNISPFPVTGASTWSVDRLRFLKKDRLLAFRLWQNSTSVTDMRIGNYELGFKPMRPGRI